MVTFFKTVLDRNNPYLENIQLAIDRIKEGNSRQLIEAIRNTTDEAQRKALKIQLPCVAFHGEFTERALTGFVKHSGFTCLDWDKIPVEAKIEELKNDEFIYAAWISASGNGVRALIEISADNEQDHSLMWRALELRYPDMDPAVKDIPRVTFESYDPELYQNSDHTVWEELYNPKPTNHLQIKTPLDMIHNAPDGERHAILLRASRLMGGYISGGHVDEREATRLIEQEWQKRPFDHNYPWRKTIEDGIKNGKQLPIEEIRELTEKENEWAHKMWYTLEDVWEKMLDMYEHGDQQGVSTGFKELDAHYTIMPGCTTYIYGAAYAGKTQFWFQLLVNLSKLHGWFHCIFSPEDGGPERVYRELFQIYIGKDYDNQFKAQMTREEMELARKFVGKHFLVLDPLDQGLSVTRFLDKINEAERETGVKLHTVTGDPFNEFETANKKRMDLETEDDLTLIRKHAVGNERHICILTHVGAQQIQWQEETRMRYYPPATFREIAGGQTWSRKGQAMISLWQPPEGLNDQHGTPYLKNSLVVQIQKAKPRGIGKTGSLVMLYDVKSHTLREENQPISEPVKIYDDEVPF